MNDREKGLSELVMYAIHIDRQEEAEDYFNEYVAHTNLLGKKKDLKLFEKTRSEHINYQMEKAKGKVGKK